MSQLYPTELYPTLVFPRYKLPVRAVELCREKERTIYEERDKGRFKPCLLEEDGKALGILSLSSSLLDVTSCILDVT